MTASPAAALSPARALIARLEALAEEQDDLHKRLLDTLKSYAEESECYLEVIERQIERTAFARSSVVVEAAFLIAEHEDEAAFGGRVYNAKGGFLFAREPRSMRRPVQ